MLTKQLSALCDTATEAHSQIQKEFKDINPIVGVNQNMRKNGIATDVMTIDCLKTNKRIILILNDQQPDIINYQFCFRNKDPEGEYLKILYSEVNVQKLFAWMRDYFMIH
ncbi:MAG: hypothetical protein HQL46_04385 [Gammaproteobacteria bacterium]|nr:hypothetical protein [Gammaproteobacteria bacterium]